MIDGVASLAFSSASALDVTDASHAAEIACALDNRPGVRAATVLELRPATFLVLLLDVLDEPLVRAVGRLAEDVGALQDAWTAGMISGHEDVVEFGTALNAAQWGHESILRVLSEMRSVVQA